VLSDGRQCRSPVLAVLAAVLSFAVLPSAAQAHGPIAPYASAYLARVGTLPAGIEAKVIDGDQGMWLRAPAASTVVVFDYRGAPYLRFSAAGVAVNHDSAMFYLNQNPAQTPPAGLGPATAPRWQQVTSAHEYKWHDGRLHALATVALRPGASFVGTWRIPIAVDGRRTAVSGGLWHADSPSIVWFWPIVVLLACALAVARVHRRRLEATTSAILAVAALIATATIALGAELYGRPHVVAGQLVILGLVLAFVAYGLIRVLSGRAGGFDLFVISFVALWAGGALVTVLLNGFVLMAIPAFLARTAVVVALGCGGGLFLGLLARMDRGEDAQAAAPDGVAGVAVR
jgi:hypothetical protein